MHFTNNQNTSSESRKKILLVTRPICPPWDEASKNFAYYLSKNIKGCEIHILTNGILPDLPSNVIQEPIYNSGGFSLSQKIKLFNFLRKNRNSFDIVHYLFTPTKQNSFFIESFAKPKRGTSIQTIATLREDLYSDEDIKKMLFADMIITYSNYSKNKLENLGFKNVQRIYPGIDLDLYSPAPRNKKIMDDFGISPDNFVITYHGEFTRLGGTDNLIGAIVKNADILKEENIKIILACRTKNEADRKKKEETLKIIRENNLENYVKLPDTFITLEKIYNLADIATFPIENMKGKFDVPLVVIEAMACEKPVIISDLPIFNEFANNQNSVKIEAGDMEKFFQAVLDFKKNPDHYSELGKNSRKYVLENFDIKKTAEKYQAVYQNS